MNRILEWWASIPDVIRKPIRDFLVIFLGLVIAGGIFQQTSPDWHAVILTVKGAAGLAAWRVLRGLRTKNTDPPEPPTSGP